MAKRSVAVRISGQEYRIRSEADEAWLQRVAGCVDAAMAQIRDRTGTVDTLDVAILTSLNLAREVLALRARLDTKADADADVGDERLRTLIELAERAVERGEGRGLEDASRRDGEETALLTVPAGDEVEDVQEGLIGPMMEALEAGGDLIGNLTAGPEVAGTGSRKARP